MIIHYYVLSKEDVFFVTQCMLLSTTLTEFRMTRILYSKFCKFSLCLHSILFLNMDLYLQVATSTVMKYLTQI